MSATEAEAKVYEALPDNKRIVKRALRMLPSWRETVPILNKNEPEKNGYERFYAYEENIVDPSHKPPDTGLWREEVFDAFRAASKVLSYKEKHIFEKINGVNLDTMEIFKPIDRQTIALDHNYSDESGVRKAEVDICKIITAKLCEIGFVWAVSLQKITLPAGCPRTKHLMCYKYFPNCGKDGGVLVFDTTAKRFEVVQTSEDDTMNSLRYATLATKGLEKYSPDELPSNLFIVRFVHVPDTLTPLQWIALWSRRSSLHTGSNTPHTAR